MEPTTIITATTVTEALDQIGMGRAQFMLLGYCGLAWAADAWETMLLSYLGPSVHCAWPESVGPAAESILSSVVFAGMLGGVYVLGAVADAHGRRRGFLLSAVLLGVAGLASAVAPSFGWLLLARSLVGVALGGTPVAVTLFAEFAPSATRGSWLLVLQSFWTVGTMMEALLAWAVLPTLGWRWLVGLSAAPLLALLAAFPWLPESPHWLVAQHRYEEAEEVLRRMARVNGHAKELQLSLDRRRQRNSGFTESGDAGEGFLPAHTAAAAAPAAHRKGHPISGGDAEVVGDDPASSCNGDGASSRRQAPDVTLIRTSIEVEREMRGGWEPRRRPPWLPHMVHRAAAVMGEGFQHIFSPQLCRTTLLLWGIWFVNAITYYGLVLLSTALQQADPEHRCTPQGTANFQAADFRAVLITSAGEAPGLLAAALLVDSQGRTWSIRAGLLLCAVSMLCLLSGPGYAGRLALLFAARASIEGTFSVLYIYSPELYPTAFRSFGLALCNGFSRLGGFAAPFATVWLVDQGQTRAAEGLLGTLCLAAAAAAFGLRYETRNRDLQSDQLDEGGASPNGSRPGAAEGEGARLLT